LSVSIDKCIYAIIEQKLDEEICINYFGKKIVDKVGQIERGLVRGSTRKTAAEKENDTVSME